MDPAVDDEALAYQVADEQAVEDQAAQNQAAQNQAAEAQARENQVGVLHPWRARRLELIGLVEEEIARAVELTFEVRRLERNYAHPLAIHEAERLLYEAGARVRRYRHELHRHQENELEILEGLGYPVWFMQRGRLAEILDGFELHPPPFDRGPG
ncbi:hypothetical protein N7488_005062 [Penicillium malachiteum]|nr:hypothetical protein N7488_005062 [Penicillium malachiteum]